MSEHRFPTDPVTLGALAAACEPDDGDGRSHLFDFLDFGAVEKTRTEIEPDVVEVTFEEGREPYSVHEVILALLAEIDRQRDQLARAQALVAVLADLDRCEHGRHQTDHCSGCAQSSRSNGPSLGNPIARMHGGQLGYDIGGNPIVVPERARMHEPRAWRGK